MALLVQSPHVTEQFLAKNHILLIAQRSDIRDLTLLDFWLVGDLKSSLIGGRDIIFGGHSALGIASRFQPLGVSAQTGLGQQ
jgi:hypothetical protein